MNHHGQPSSYRKRNHSFLLRIWQEGAQTPWRASVQSVRTGETVRFAELADLFAFLGSQTSTAVETEEKSTSDQGVE